MKEHKEGVYQNSTELMDLGGKPFYMNDFVDACLYGRLNLFLQGDTGSGKTQLAKDAMDYFGTTLGDGEFAKEFQEKFLDKLDNKSNYALSSVNKFGTDKTMFLLGRNDMDTRELFQRFNLGRLNQKPKYNLEPLVDIENGEINYYYPIFIFIAVMLATILVITLMVYKYRKTSFVLLGSILFFLIFFMFSLFAFINYYYFVSGLVILYLVLRLGKVMS